MKTIDFCEKYSPCEDGREFAMRHETMMEVWENCKRADWLFWILKKYNPQFLDQKQSVTLAIAFAESSLKFVPDGEHRPRLAIEAAKTWLENTNGKNFSAAFSASHAADAASHAADAASYAADAATSESRYADYAAYAARSATNAHAYTAPRSSRAPYIKACAAQCDMMRGIIANPF